MTQAPTPGAGPLRALVGDLAAGRLSPSEAMAETARRVEALDGRLNPFLHVDLDHGAAQARLLERGSRAGRALYGLPITLKDLEPTQDLPTTWGAGDVDAAAPRADGVLAERMRAAGCVVYGKTSTPSYGHKDTCDNAVVGITRNPWNPELTPGGSSGGAAVMVAAGVDLVAHGTDAAGSVRMPAALTGVTGFKPSHGRLPRVPSGDLWAARGHHGFLGTCVDDVRVVTAALAGGDARDPIGPSEQHLFDGPPRARRGRIALATSLFNTPVDPAVAALVRSVGDTLSEAGWAIEEVAPGWSDPVEWAMRYAEAVDHQALAARAVANPAAFVASQHRLVDAGASVSAADLFAYAARRSELFVTATQLMDSYDAILTPTLPRVAWGVADDHPLVDGVRTRYGPSGRWADVLLGNLTGWPAASIPCGFVDGLPVGLQVIAPWRQDEQCLELSEQIESVLGAEVRRQPPLHVAAV